MLALVTVLTRVRRIHLDQLSPGTFCLVRQHIKELLNIFNGYELKTVDDFSMNLAHCFTRFWQKLWCFNLTREGPPPLAAGIALNGTRLWCSFERTVKFNLDLSYLGKRERCGTQRP